MGYNQLKQRVYLALNNAVANGYPPSDDNAEVAAELQRYDSDLESAGTRRLIRFIKAWRKKGE